MRWLDPDEQRALAKTVHDCEEIDPGLADAIIRLHKRKLVGIRPCPWCGSVDCAIALVTTPLYELISRSLKEVGLS